MKHSEFIRKRIEKWQFVAGCPPSQAERLAAQDAEEFEAAGVQWEPEEPGLPVRLEWDGGSGAVRTPGGLILVDLSIDRADSPEEFKKRDEPVLIAMVEAYNRWGPKGTRREKLRRVAIFLRERRGWDVSTVLGRIEALLDEGGDVG